MFFRWKRTINMASGAFSPGRSTAISFSTRQLPHRVATIPPLRCRGNLTRP
jgi:hypothetical protein